MAAETAALGATTATTADAGAGAGASSDAQLPIADAHFHLWNVDEIANPNLGELPDAFRTYLPDNYTAHFARQCLAACVHVETIVGQKDGGAKLDEVGETRWLTTKLPAIGVPYAIVGYAHLERDDCEEVLKSHIAAAPSNKFRGIRMIQNHHPDDPALTWPQVSSEAHFATEEFRRGLALLEKYGLSFDLQANPHQLARAATVFADFPKVPVIINHMGSLLLGKGDDADAKMMTTWREGMAALAALPHVYVKLSFMAFTKKDWEKSDEGQAQMKKIATELIDLFGTDRCMFASNFPVDGLLGVDPDVMYGQFRAWISGMPRDAQLKLLHDNCVRAYRIDGAEEKAAGAA